MKVSFPAPNVEGANAILTCNSFDIAEEFPCFNVALFLQGEELSHFHFSETVIILINIRKMRAIL